MTLTEWWGFFYALPQTLRDQASTGAIPKVFPLKSGTENQVVTKLLNPAEKHCPDSRAMICSSWRAFGNALPVAMQKNGLIDNQVVKSIVCPAEKVLGSVRIAPGIQICANALRGTNVDHH